MTSTAARLIAASACAVVVGIAVLSPALTFARGAGGAGGVIIYVDDDASPGGDGLSWDTAFRFLQDALAYADEFQNDVGEIRIAQGIYFPDRDELNPNGTADRDATFSLFFGGAVRGGYAGQGAPDPDERDAAVYQTTLSGDLLGNDGPGFVAYGDNSLVLVNDAQTAPMVDGLIVRSAIVGMEVHDATITNCLLEHNKMAARSIKDGDGGFANCSFSHNKIGIYGLKGDVSVVNCTFTNHLKSPIFAGIFFSTTICGCTFDSNAGGAIRVHDALSTIDGCTFSNNVGLLGGAIRFEGGGNCLVSNCTFLNNSAAKGGAIFSRGSDLDPSTLQFHNCLFFENTSLLSAGVHHNKLSESEYRNCSVVKNAGLLAGGIYSSNSSTLRVFNSIMRSNPGGSFAGTGARTVKFSNIAGGHPGAGNINTAAHFVNHTAGNFRLKPSSPCIDAGKTGLFTYSVPTDLDGNPRFVDAPNTPNTGEGNPPIDMGAYEFQP